MQSSNSNQDTPKKDSIIGLLIRLTWMFVGYIPFVAAFLYIMRNNAKISKWDFIYWGTFIALTSLKYVDYKFFEGQTAEGEPATIKNVRDYAVRLFIFVIVFYIIAKYQALSSKI